MCKSSNNHARRGVLLLVVLSVLALFALLALAFILVAAHHRRSATAAARATQSISSPQNDLDEAFHQVVRGTTNTASVLRPHSLLEDIYGQAPLTWSVGIPTADDDGDGTVDETDGSESVLPADFAALSASNPQLYELTLSDPVHQNGCVLTMVDGPAAGQSTRIVGINPSTGKAQILAFQGTPPIIGDHYVVNGTPFSGTGFGFNSADGTLNAVDANGWPLALLPNDTTVNCNPPGGPNEDYDAVDYQNMLLAMVTTSGSVPMPSFHRPELINYWYNVLYNTYAPLSGLTPENRWKVILRPWGLDGIRNNADDSASPWSDVPIADRDLIVDLRRRILLRPILEDHPNFTGSNPTAPSPSVLSFTTTSGGVQTYWERGDQGSWDIDNDGDGVPDSLWVDLGAPVRSTADGRLYKPLYAILCTDLDGRFNLNAHGSLAQVDTTYYGGVDLANPYFTPPITGSFAFSDTFGGAPIYLPRGLGWGPGEINPRRLFSDLTSYQTFLKRRYTSGPTDALWLPGTNSLDDYLSWNIFGEYGGAYWTLGTPNSAGAYGSPPAPQGKAVIGLDTTGHPLYCAMGVNEQIDDPYELNLSEHSVADSPFTVAELERILRPYDSDLSTLPDRLKDLVSAAGRHSVTTDSWDVPCPSLAVSQELRDALADKRLHHLTDLLAARGILPAAYKYLWPPEMLAGLRMDLNRPFGNGYDDNSPANNVIDEPAEAATGTEPAHQVNSSGALIPGIPFSHTDGIDVNGDGLVDTTDKAMARQLYARNLYVLALLVIHYPNVAPASLSQDDKNRARVVAQWAANAVDFRDRDSIMTPFEYDISPFYDDSATPDGIPWDVDGVIGTADDSAAYRGLVWGCERPELLISETLALHDRRTEDLDTDPTGKVAADEPVPQDFDQRIKPQGSLFVELYNPNTAMEPLPAELCSGTDGTSTGGAGVDLTKVATDGTTTSPVWRLGIVTRENGASDPDTTVPPVSLDRTVYFVNTASATLPSDGAGIQYYPSTTSEPTIRPIRPGRYAMVGPGDPGELASNAGVSTTYLGFKTDGTHGDTSTRRIMLDTSFGSVAVTSDGTTDDLTALSLTYLPVAVPVVIDEPQRLCITTTSGGYPAYPSGQTQYVPPYDAPLDAGNPMWQEIYSGTIGLKDNGIVPKVRVVHLQRLANPLLPYNATTNPYLTVDTIPIDLHSFNGATSAADFGETGTLPDIMSRQRGERTVATYGNNIWTQEPLDPYGDPPTNNGPGLPTTTLTNHYITVPFHGTFGYLNYAFGTPRTAPAGDPPTPFPWLTWPNRPLVSQYELLEVPAASSRQLLMNVNDLAVDNPFSMAFSYGSGIATAAPYTNAKQPFGHLLNFCFSTTFGGSALAADPPSNLARLLDFVQVPSRFVGASLQANPVVFGNPALGDHSFQPPFQHIPLYREPGKVNLNTVFDQRVWEGLINFFPDMDTARVTPMFWNQFVASRRGYGTTSDVETVMSDLYPTRFANPFRSAGGASLVPSTWPIGSGHEDNDLKETVKREPNATLLRAEFSPPPLPVDPARPLLEFDQTSAATITPPTGGQPTISDLNDPNRNPYFANQVISRLGNLVTTRSNVYAVWITVGYFEVTPWPSGVDAAHPDGYQLGRELGTDTGEIKRHRAFYIFDRSIPVGFQRGQNLNVDKAVLLKRFIE